jgi:hypothetical protein
VVWVQNDGTVNSIYGNVFAGGVWNGVALVEDGAEPASDARVAGHADGYLAAWTQSDGTNTRVYANRYAGGAWGSASALDEGTGGAGSPEVAGGPAGYAVVWPQPHAGVVNLYGSVYNGVWGQFTLLENVNADIGAKYRYDVTAAGDGFAAVWAQPNPADTPNATTQRIWAAGF